MKLILPVGLDPAEAEKILQQFRAAAAARLKVRAQIETGDAVEALGEVEQAAEGAGSSLDQLGSRAAKSLDGARSSIAEVADEMRKASFVERVESFTGGLEQLGEVVPQVFGELNPALAEGVTNTLDLASGGAQVGAAFGPLGALLGGVAGAIAGVTRSIVDYFDDTDDRLAAQIKEVERLANLASDLEKSMGRVLGLEEKSAELGSRSATLSAGLASSRVGVEDSGSLRARVLDEKTKDLAQEVFDLDRRRQEALSETLRLKEQLASVSETGAEYRDLKRTLTEQEKLVESLDESLTTKIALTEAANASYLEALAEEEAAQSRVETATKAATKAIKEQAKAKEDPLGLGAITDPARLARSQAQARAVTVTGPLEDPGALLGRIIDAEAGPQDLGLAPVLIPVEVDTSPLAAGLLSAQELINNFAASTEDALLDAFGGSVLGAVEYLFDAIATGQRLTAAGALQAAGERAGAAFRAAGSELVAQGAVHAGQGVGRLLLTGGVAGGALATHGLAEIAQGVAWGAVGAGLERLASRGSQDDAATPGGGLGAATRSPARDNLRDPGPQDLGGVTIYAGGGPGSTTIYAGDGVRSQVKAFRELERINAAGKGRSAPGVRGL